MIGLVTDSGVCVGLIVQIYCMGGTFQATARFQDSDTLEST